MFQLLLKGCTIEAVYRCLVAGSLRRFSCCWKDVRLKPIPRKYPDLLLRVSVVVERMYDWSVTDKKPWRLFLLFQLLLKGCTIEAQQSGWKGSNAYSFSCCWKDVRLKPLGMPAEIAPALCFSCCWKDVRLKHFLQPGNRNKGASFSCCWKDVRLKLPT